jgi:hypothetical protein
MKKIKQEVKIVIKSLPVIILSMFLVMTVIHAWSGPPGLPPFCPTGDPGCDAPINVSGVTQFKSGAFGVGGLFETDGNTYLAKSGGNVGIGTTTPGAKLVISGADSNSSEVLIRQTTNGRGIRISPNGAFIDLYEGSGPFHINRYSSLNISLVEGGGNVGIGTTDPDSKLHVVTPSGAQATERSLIVGGTAVGQMQMRLGRHDDGYTWIQSVAKQTSNDRALVFNPSGGNVGIGTTTPAEKLHVNGTIRTTIVNCGQLGTDANGNIVCKD